MFFRGKKEPVVSLGKLYLRISGMRGTEEYEILSNGSECEICNYHLYYCREEDKRELIKSVKCPDEKVFNLLSECNVIAWDGFDGPNPRGVLDGYMFRFEAEINGKKIRAEGSNNYPKHYHAFLDGIRAMLYGGGEDDE